VAHGGAQAHTQVMQVCTLVAWAHTLVQVQVQMQMQVCTLVQMQVCTLVQVQVQVCTLV
jgi:hypothetical protein